MHPGPWEDVRVSALLTAASLRPCHPMFIWDTLKGCGQSVVAFLTACGFPDGVNKDPQSTGCGQSRNSPLPFQPTVRTRCSKITSIGTGGDGRLGGETGSVWEVFWFDWFSLSVKQQKTLKSLTRADSFPSVRWLLH